MFPITPAGYELLKAINQDIDANGEARCVKRIVEERCTLHLRYAYALLKRNDKQWGLEQKRVPSQRGGYELSITKEKNNEKC